MKKIMLVSIGLLIVAVAVNGQNGKLIRKVLENRFDKESAPNTGPVPDYNKREFWVASPYKNDNGDSIPDFLQNEVRDQRADVFFIHPTSFFGDTKTAAWNADLTDREVNRTTENRSILFQATVFNGNCRIFAPHYRQANMKAFYVRDTPSAQAAFDLAYSDVKMAFEWYLKHENKGRPIIIASHSQGSLHAIRLLQEFFDGKSLQKQLVCAYIVGYQIKKDAFKTIPVGARSNQTGCFVGWRSYIDGEIPRGVTKEEGNSVCVNPITWTTSTEWSPNELHGGIMAGFKTIVPHTVSCAIEPSTKILWVKTPVQLEEKAEKIKNLHIYDYNLFWLNIRQNVKLRIDAFLAR
jgi:Protein of unknown function (DUF3089).